MIKEKYFLLTISIGIISTVLTSYYSQYHYDGHHYGLVFDNSLDLLNGKKPFEEIFLLYGIGTVLAHSIALKIFGEHVHSLIFFTSILYSLSLVSFFFLSKKFISKKSSFYLILSIFFIHPVPEYPWANYIIFFLLSTGLTFLFSQKKFWFLVGSILIGSCVLLRQEILIYIFILFLFILLMKIFNRKIKFNNFLFLFLSSVPIIIFILYLYYNQLFENYKIYYLLPKIYLEFKNLNLLILFKRFLEYLFIPNLNKIIFEPYLIIFAISLIINAFYLNYVLLSNFNKNISFQNINLSIVSLISILFITQSFNEINIFRLICGSSIGFITLFYCIEKFEEKYKDYLILIIVLLSLSSLSLLNRSSSNSIYKYDFEIEKSISNKLSFFQKNKFKKDTTKNLISADEHFKKIKTYCDIKYFSNLQKDVFYRLLAKQYFETFKITPFYEDKAESYAFIKYFDSDYISKLKKLIKTNQVVIITDYENLEYIKFSKDIIYFENYKISKILPFSYEQKLKVILTPNNCNLK